jgi:uncharacterized membrane protein
MTPVAAAKTMGAVSSIKGEGRMDEVTLHHGTAHSLASQVLASGSGHGGYHLRIILIVVVVIVVAVMVWIVLAGRARRKRGES